MIRTLASAAVGILGAAAALLAVGAARQLDRFAVLMILTIVAAGPAALITAGVLDGIDHRLRWHPTPGRLARGVVAGLVEFLALMFLAWIVFGVTALLVNREMVLPGLAAGTGLTFGCLAGLGPPKKKSRDPRPAPIELSRNGPPFFDTRSRA